jgi:hypothetical protein
LEKNPFQAPPARRRPGKASANDLFGEKMHMNTLSRWPIGRGVALTLAVAVAVGLAGGSGCQTYVVETGQTLPTGEYLKHPPQFIPDSPQFPLSREEAGLEKANLQGGSPAAQPGGF